MMRLSIAPAALALIGLVALIPTESVAQGNSTDLWDISQGSIVTTNSLLVGLPGEVDARNVFGGTFGTIEPGNTIFADQQGLGFVHFVEWQTPTLIRLDSFDLYASGDIGAPYGSDFHDFGEFRLYSKTTSNGAFQLVEDYTPTHPFPHAWSPVTFTPGSPVVGQFFRADFVQYDKGFFDPNFDYLGGPRIVELDGFGAAVPEPGPLALLTSMAFGGIGILLRRRRK